MRAVRVSTPISLGHARCTAVSPEAIMVTLADGKQLWVPQSQVHDDSEVYRKGDSGKLVVTEWWAQQRNLV